MAYEHWMKNGVTLGRNTELIQAPQGNTLPVYFQEVELTPMLENEIIVQALNFYRAHPEYKRRKLTIVQMFFPDEKGLLPFEDGFNAEFEQTNLQEQAPA